MRNKEPVRRKEKDLKGRGKKKEEHDLLAKRVTQAREATGF